MEFVIVGGSRCSVRRGERIAPGCGCGFIGLLRRQLGGRPDGVSLGVVEIWRGGAGHEGEKGRRGGRKVDWREDEGRRMVKKEGRRRAGGGQEEGSVLPGKAPSNVLLRVGVRRGESGLKIRNCLSCTLNQREPACARRRSTA